MADRYVKIDIRLTGDNEAKRGIQALRTDADELTKKRSIPISANDDDAKAKLVDLRLNIGKLTDKSHDVKIDVNDDAAKAKMIRLQLQLEKIDRSTAHPNISLRGADRAQAQLFGIKAQMDELDRKSSSGSGFFGKLSGLFGGGSSGGGVASEAASAGGAGGPGTALLATAGTAGILSLLPGVLGLGIGGLVGGGAVAGGLFGASQGSKQLKSDSTTITQLQKLVAAGGGQGLSKAQAQSQLSAANKAFSKDSAFFQPFMEMQKSLSDLLQVVIKPLRATMGPLATIFQQFGKSLNGLGPELSQMFKASLPFIKAFLTLMLSAGKQLIPAFTQAMVTMVKSGALNDMMQGLVIVTKGLAGFIKALGPGMKASAEIFQVLCKGIAAILVGVGQAATLTANGFMQMSHIIKTAASDAFNGVHHTFDAMRAYISKTFDDIRHDVASTWDGMLKGVETSASQSLRSVLNDFTSWRHDIANGFDSLRHSVASIWGTMWNEVKNLTNSGVHGVANAIHGIEGAFRTPVAFVVNDVWDRLAGIWNKITGIVHLSSLKLPIAHFADGGKVTQGTGPRSDDVLARVSKGETVVSAQHSNMLAGIFGAVGVPGYAAGGIPNPIKSVGGFFSGLGHDVLSLLAKPASFIMSRFFGGIEGMLGHIPGVSPAMDSVLSGLTKNLLSTLVGKAHNAGQSQVSTGRFGGHFGAGVAQWKGLVLKALRMEGLSAGLVGDVLYQMQTESSGNPNAINLTDSNAAAGDPSRGLMQTIMSTFRAYHWPGTSWDIYNPLANIAAALNYGAHNHRGFGTGPGQIGSGHGYANGGWITEPISGFGLRTGQRYSFGEKGMEYVTPNNRLGRGGGGDTIIINIESNFDSDKTAQKIHQTLSRYKNKRGRGNLGLG